jgi:hypothetical protein
MEDNRKVFSVHTIAHTRIVNPCTIPPPKKEWKCNKVLSSMTKVVNISKSEEALFYALAFEVGLKLM